jgi:drug/metabolite transporter (DMT)-like permease
MTSAALPIGRPSARSQAGGAALVFVSTVAWSFSGVFTRLLTTDVLTAIAWRAFFGCLFLAVPFAMRERGRVWAAFAPSWPAALLILCITICSACTVGALYETSIANAAVIYATAPFMAAGLALVLVGERLKVRTLVASAVALLGVAVIVSGGFGQGGVLGDVLAVGMTLSFAFMIVLPRLWPQLNLSSASILGAGLTCLLFAPFGHARTMPPADWTVLAGFGFINFTVALLLFLTGARHLAAAQAALIGTLDVILAPLWVWIGFGERPGPATFVGGGMIFAVVVWHTLLEWRDERQAICPKA